MNDDDAFARNRSKWSFNWSIFTFTNSQCNVNGMNETMLCMVEANQNLMIPQNMKMKFNNLIKLIDFSFRRLFEWKSCSSPSFSFVHFVHFFTQMSISLTLHSPGISNMFFE